MTPETCERILQERIRRLEAMARQWDRCAANSQETSYLNGDASVAYRGYAAACRKKAAELHGSAAGSAS